MNVNGLKPAGSTNNKKNRRYKCIFFDLDHTLWDYECNARAMLLDLHTAHKLSERGIDFEDFHLHFRTINLQLWEQYDKGMITNEIIRNQRFTKVLEQFKMRDDDLCSTLSYEYFHGCAKKSALVPYAKEVLAYLSDHYALTVVTNGFDEIQGVKLMSGNITHYFNHIITSQRAGHKKPSREIFEYALSANNLRSDEVIMIGDNLITDIGGARNARIDTVFYNPAKIVHGEEVTHEIRCLSELQNIL